MTMQTTGNSSPLGATVGRGGVNFSLYSRQATGVELLLFDKPDDAKPACVVSLDPVFNRSYHYWHVFVPGLQPAQIYGYRAPTYSIVAILWATDILAELELAHDSSIYPVRHDRYCIPNAPRFPFRDATGRARAWRRRIRSWHRRSAVSS